MNQIKLNLKILRSLKDIRRKKTENKKTIEKEKNKVAEVGVSWFLIKFVLINDFTVDCKQSCSSCISLFLFFPSLYVFRYRFSSFILSLSLPFFRFHLLQIQHARNNDIDDDSTMPSSLYWNDFAQMCNQPRWTTISHTLNVLICSIIVMQM